MNSKRLPSICAALVLLSSGGAMATPPPQCQSGVYRLAYDRSMERYGAAIEYYFESLGENPLERCLAYDDFADVVMNLLSRLNLGSAPSDYTMCRMAGLMQGVVTAIYDTEYYCHEECSLEGALVGGLEASWYCQLAFVLGPPAVDWMPEPIETTCGFDFALECSFVWDATAHDETDPITAETCYDVFGGTESFVNGRGESCQLPEE